MDGGDGDGPADPPPHAGDGTGGGGDDPDDSTYGAMIDVGEVKAEERRAKNKARADALLDQAFEDDGPSGLPEEVDAVYAVPVEETDDVGAPPAVPRRPSMSAGGNKKRVSVYGGFGDDAALPTDGDGGAEGGAGDDADPKEVPVPSGLIHTEGLTSYNGSSYKETPADAEEYQTPAELLGMVLPPPKPSGDVVAGDGGGGGGGGGGEGVDDDDDDGVYAALDHTPYSAPEGNVVARGATANNAADATTPPPVGFTKKKESFRGFGDASKLLRAPSLKLQGFGGGGGDESSETAVEETVGAGSMDAKAEGNAEVIPETCDRYKLDFHRRGICKTCHLSREDCGKIRPASMLPRGPGSRPASVAPPISVQVCTAVHCAL